MDAFERPNFETVTLQKIRFAVQTRLSAEALDSYVDDFYAEYVAHDLEVGVRGCVWGKEKTKQFEYPTTWLDAFKLRWFPEWALERWPPSITLVSVTARAWFPDLRVQQRGNDLRMYFSADTRFDTSLYRPSSKEAPGQ